MTITRAPHAAAVERDLQLAGERPAPGGLIGDPLKLGLGQRGVVVDADFPDVLPGFEPADEAGHRRLLEFAEAGELPEFLREENGRGVPQRSVIALGAVGTGLAAIGSLGGLVEAASLTFLVTFAGGNYLAATDSKGSRWLPAIGAFAAGAAALVAAWRLATEQPASLIALAAITFGLLA